tara:strand:- start:524 stop:730 length:207 start_codon:yes stop_codon:yes gene_type:complete
MRRGRRKIDKDIESPCIKVCKLENDRCIGCWRSSEEIREWIIYSKEKRKAIMDELMVRAAIHIVDRGI